ncbi:glucosyl-3-phosphoglycerate synthase [Allonocardiopsis opalescens]|uniref:glucosyl-3-phosphoglycerate synthase n=1 Tax=Allonocardiopsis opalescens TaxID=1144618 RepID=UPI000D04DD2A|nr:glucosyl-3-phosphoglycerate synthase [Allonocardiopsis opalescens]
MALEPPEVASWLARRTSAAGDWDPRALAEAKGGTRVSVVLPARDEERTVGRIVTTIREVCAERLGLVDEIVVVDSRSTDATARTAAAAGATVVHQDEVLPELGRGEGKGEALWKSLYATTGDIIVFIDADLRDFGPHFVTGLLGPLLTDPSVGYVKGFYDRPLLGSSGERTGSGGRVTELVARPLLGLHWPLLTGFVQPLGGEYAGRRSLLERVPFVSGYGVELGLLIDLLDAHGLDALAQVDLGVRTHSHQSVHALGAMAAQLQLTAWSRLERGGWLVASAAPGRRLIQFERTERGHVPVPRDIALSERPPMIGVPAYAALARGR